jgi:hypothetical protein
MGIDVEGSSPEPFKPKNSVADFRKAYEDQSQWNEYDRRLAEEDLDRARLSVIGNLLSIMTLKISIGDTLNGSTKEWMDFRNLILKQLDKIEDGKENIQNIEEAIDKIDQFFNAKPMLRKQKIYGRVKKPSGVKPVASSTQKPGET